MLKKSKSEGSVLNLKSLEENIEHVTTDTSIDENESIDSWNNLITLETFNDWISVASYKIECLDLAIKIYRWRLQTCIMLGLLLSTASGTISVTQFGNYSSGLKFGLNLVLTITSFAVALLTGIVKTFKLQENLEEYISLKQSWVSFSAKISNEIYLPKKMRGNAETLIKENKARFLDLLKVDVPIPKEMSILAAKHLDKGDDIESQYYKYRENIIKNEKDMNQNYMKCLSFFFNCCNCFYKKDTVKKILDNRELERTIKYSKIENETKYKRRAYQYTLSSIMLNNVKNEYNEIKLSQGLHKKDIETQTASETSTTKSLNDKDVQGKDSSGKDSSSKDSSSKDSSGKDSSIKDTSENVPIISKLEETVAVVTSKVSDMVSRKKKGSVSKITEEKTEEKIEEKIEEKS